MLRQTYTQEQVKELLADSHSDDYCMMTTDESGKVTLSHKGTLPEIVKYVAYIRLLDGPGIIRSIVDYTGYIVPGHILAAVLSYSLEIKAESYNWVESWFVNLMNGEEYKHVHNYQESAEDTRTQFLASIDVHPDWIIGPFPNLDAAREAFFEYQEQPVYFVSLFDWVYMSVPRIYGNTCIDKTLPENMLLSGPYDTIEEAYQESMAIQDDIDFDHWFGSKKVLRYFLDIRHGTLYPYFVDASQDDNSQALDFAAYSGLSQDAVFFSFGPFTTMKEAKDYFASHTTE